MSLFGVTECANEGGSHKLSISLEVRDHLPKFVIISNSVISLQSNISKSVTILSCAQCVRSSSIFVKYKWEVCFKEKIRYFREAFIPLKTSTGTKWSRGLVNLLLD